MNYSILYRAVFLGLTPMIISTQVTAHEKHDTVMLDTIKIEDNTNQDTFDREVNTEYLERTQAQDLQDIFKLEPSVQVGTGSRNGQKIFMRGVEDLHLNVQVDGVRQGSNNFHHQGRVDVDPFLLKKVEVKPGPAAADAGPGALGGSVKFETVDAQDLLKPGQTVGARIGANYESSSNLTGGMATVYGKAGEHAGLLVHTRRSSNDAMLAGWGDERDSTAGWHEDYQIKASLLDMDGHSLRLNVQNRVDDGGDLRANFPWETNFGSSKAGEDISIYESSQSLNYGYRPEGQDKIDLKFSLYNSKTGLKHIFGSKDADWRTLGYGGDLHNTSLFKTESMTHALTYGVDYFYTEGQDDTEGNPLLKEHGSNTGVYIQDRIDLGVVRLSAGLRQDSYQAKYDNQYDDSGSEISPNISGEWDLLKGDTNLTVFAGYGQSIRGGRLNQAGWIRKYPANPTTFQLGNNGKLEAETSHQTEWGARWHDVNFFTKNDHIGLDITFYDNVIKDYLITPGEGSAATDSLYNADGDVTSKGYEVRGHWGARDLLLSLSYSHNRFRDYNGLPGDTTGSSARVGASTGDRWVFDGTWDVKPNVTLGYTLTAVDKLTDVPSGRPDKPGYLVQDIQLLWQPSIAKDDLHITLALENITDERYAEHTTVRTYYNGSELASWESGRNLRVGVEWLF